MSLFRKSLGSLAQLLDDYEDNQIKQNTPTRDHSPQIPEGEDRPKPYLTPTGDLVIPMDSHPKYHYWRGGQDLLETLLELGADEETIRRYVDDDIESIRKRMIH